MTTKTSKSRKLKTKSGIRVNEFAEHFGELLEPMSTGEVEGVAMAVVTGDRVIWSTLVTKTMAALILRDTTRELWMECERRVHDDMEAACRKAAAARGGKSSPNAKNTKMEGAEEQTGLTGRG